MKFKKLPCQHLPDYKIGILLALTLLTLINAYTLGSSVITQVGIAVVVAAIADGIVIKLRSKRWYAPNGAMISAMIIALLINPGDIQTTAYVVLIMVALKHIVNIKHRNIFNPAAFAVVMSSFFLPVYSSWWGATGMATFIIGLLLVLAIKRWIIALSYYVPYLVLMALKQGAAFTPGFLSGPPAFFAFFMVIEPVTTAKTQRGQLWFGLGVALLAFLFSFSPWMVGNSFFLYISLMIMNLLMRLLPNHILE
ncbi:MAG: RnfABCDGE type electron transport complex subunit D [Candidatus Nanoarchaeia archaeon]